MGEDLERMRGLLVDLMSVERAEKASEELKKMLAKIENLPLLLRILLSDELSEIRQLAAVLFRKRILKQWTALDDNAKTEIRELLLNQISQEDQQPVRMAIAHSISTIAKVSDDQWGTRQLTPAVIHLIINQPVHREVGYTILTSLIENFPAQLLKQLPDLVQAFSQGLVDKDNTSVCIAALRGVQVLSNCVEEDEHIEALRPVLVPTTQLIEKSLDDDCEDIAQLGLEILDDMMEGTDLFKSDDILFMVKFMLNIASKKNLDCGIRDQALHFIHWVAKNKPKSLYKNNNLVNPILDVLMSMGAEEEEDEMDDDSLSGHRIACQCMDSLALNLPNKYIYFPALRKLSPFIQSTNPLEKKAALVLLGIMSEGCDSIMRTKLNEILPFVFGSFEDPSPSVKAAAATCFSQLSEYLQPEILTYHEAGMGHLYRLLDSPQPVILEKVCCALEQFCGELREKQIALYFNQLLPKLLETCIKSTNMSVKQSCLGALGTLVCAAGSDIGREASKCFDVLSQTISTPGETREILALKGKALECMGLVAKGLEKDNFRPLCGQITNMVIECMDKSTDHEMRRSGYLYFVNIADCMGAEIKDYLEQIIVYVFASIFSTECFESNKSYKHTQNINDDDDDDVDDDEQLDVRTGFLDELEGAVICLKSLWDACGEHCMKYLEKTTDSIALLHQYFSSEIRELSATLMASLMNSVHDQFSTDAKEYLPGLPVQAVYVHPHTMKLWTELFWNNFKTLIYDDDKETVTGVTIALAELIETLGPQLIENKVTDLVLFMHEIFASTHVCQKRTEIDDDEDSRLEEDRLFEALSLLIGALAAVLGPQFATIYKELHNNIYALTTHKESLSYRCIGTGCAAAAFQAMGSEAEPFILPFLQPTLRALKQNDDIDLKRNAAFALGVFAEVSPETNYNHLDQVVPPLKSILAQASREELSEKEHCMLDNVIAAMSRIILTIPKVRREDRTPFPIDNFLVDNFFKHLPLKEDDDESDVVMRSLIFLIQDPVLQSHPRVDVYQYLSVSLSEITTPKSTIRLETKQQLHNVNVMLLRNLMEREPENLRCIKNASAPIQHYCSAVLSQAEIPPLENCVEFKL